MNEQLTKHKEFVLGIFENYRRKLLPQTDIDVFLSKAWIDRYDPLFPTDIGSIECKMEIKTLSMSDISEIEAMEQTMLSNPETLWLIARRFSCSLLACLFYGIRYGIRRQMFCLFWLQRKWIPVPPSQCEYRKIGF